MTGSGVQRSDFAAIAGWIRPDARVLDLGCADGSLLRYLAGQRGSVGYGVEIDDARVLGCVNVNESTKARAVESHRCHLTKN
jgi:cyclopropane fatty-acyl-phospholipid synthase-like methyltransferase